VIAVAEPLRNIAEAAEFLGIPEKTLRDKVTARLVPHTRIGRHVRSPRSTWPRSSPPASSPW
jgi:excisionase family DNA binding protein